MSHLATYSLSSLQKFGLSLVMFLALATTTVASTHSAERVNRVELCVDGLVDLGAASSVGPDAVARVGRMYPDCPIVQERVASILTDLQAELADAVFMDPSEWVGSYLAIDSAIRPGLIEFGFTRREDAFGSRRFIVTWENGTQEEGRYEVDDFSIFLVFDETRDALELNPADTNNGMGVQIGNGRVLGTMVEFSELTAANMPEARHNNSTAVAACRRGSEMVEDLGADFSIDAGLNILRLMEDSCPEIQHALEALISSAEQADISIDQKRVPSFRELSGQAAEFFEPQLGAFYLFFDQPNLNSLVWWDGSGRVTQGQYWTEGDIFFFDANDGALEPVAYRIERAGGEVVLTEVESDRVAGTFVKTTSRTPEQFGLVLGPPRRSATNIDFGDVVKRYGAWDVTVRDRYCFAKTLARLVSSGPNVIFEIPYMYIRLDRDSNSFKFVMDSGDSVSYRQDSAFARIVSKTDVKRFALPVSSSGSPMAVSASEGDLRKVERVFALAIQKGLTLKLSGATNDAFNDEFQIEYDLYGYTAAVREITRICDANLGQLLP